MKISLVIPIYNEENLIKKTLDELKYFVRNEKDTWEILLINDGSIDKTLEILIKNKITNFKIISYPLNKGKGFAIRKGVLEATGDYICFIDSDLAYSFDNLKKFIFELKNVDAVIGSRDLSKHNEENVHILRRILGKGFNMISNIILGYKMQDTQCGLKVFKREIAKDLFSKQSLNGFSFDTEILYISKKRKYNLKRGKAVVSKSHINKKSKVNLLRDPLKMFFDLLRIRLNDLLGKYE